MLSLKEKTFTNIDLNQIQNIQFEKLLRLSIDNKQNFPKQIKNFEWKARSKFSVTSRVTLFSNLNKRKLLMSVHFKALFKYLLWFRYFMITNWNDKINRSYKRSLRITYEDHKRFVELDNSISDYYKNLQCLWLFICIMHLKESLKI